MRLASTAPTRRSPYSLTIMKTASTRSREDAIAASDRRQDAANNGVITSLTSSKVQLLNDSARDTSAPRCFRCMATSSIMPTPLLSTALLKSSKSPKGVSLPPHSPNLSMYPKCLGSEAPVALQ